MPVPIAAIGKGAAIAADLAISHWDKVSFLVDKIGPMLPRGGENLRKELEQLRAEAEEAKQDTKRLVDTCERLQAELLAARASLRLQQWVTLASLVVAITASAATALLVQRL